MTAGDGALSGRRVLLTGATGFIGAHLLARLTAGGAEVHAVSRRSAAPGAGARWTRLDLADGAAVRALVSAVRPHVVLHLASEVAGSREVGLVGPMLRSNLVSAVNLLTAAAEAGGARVVLAGSVEEPCPGDPTPPSSPYAVAKWAASGYARTFHALWGLPTVVLRVAMTYGPAQPDESKLVPSTIRSLLAGRPPAIGSGTRLVDWVHVDDVVDAFVAAATAATAPGTELDIASGAPVSIRHTVELLHRITGGPAPRYGAVPDRARDAAQRADPGPARSVLGWRAGTDLEDGLRRTVAWYRRHPA